MGLKSTHIGLYSCYTMRAERTRGCSTRCCRCHCRCICDKQQTDIFTANLDTIRYDTKV